MIAETALAALTLVMSAPPSEPTTTVAPTTTVEAAPVSIPEGFIPLVDSTDTLVVAVPGLWADTTIAPVPIADEAGTEVPYLAASTDLTSFYGAFDVPGALYAAFPYILNPLGYMENFGLRTGCETLEVKEYEDPIFIGVIQIGTNCGDTGMTWNLVIANPADEAFTAVVQVQSTNPEEIKAILLTFNRR